MADSQRVRQAGEIRLARIESLRAVAALAVVGAHVYGSVHGYDGSYLFANVWRRLVFSGGFGVFLFYALSGYLLFWPFVRRHFGGGGTLNLRRYARNRALRILPLYVFAVVFLLVVQNDGGTPTLWWRHLLFVQSMWADSLTAVDGPLWSVAVELQFYALLPLLAGGLFAVAGASRMRAAVLLGVLGAVATVLRHRLADTSGDLWGYQLPTTFQFFVGGMWVALLRSAWEDRRPALLDGPLGSSTLWVLAALPLWALAAWRFSLQELCALSAFMAIGALVLPLRPGPAIRLLDWRPLALAGVASYSLYVWHVPVIDALDRHWALFGRSYPLALVVLMPLCLAVAAVSYRLIETPGLRLRRRWAPGTPDHLGSAS